MPTLEKNFSVKKKDFFQQITVVFPITKLPAKKQFETFIKLCVQVFVGRSICYYKSVQMVNNLAPVIS